MIIHQYGPFVEDINNRDITEFTLNKLQKYQGRIALFLDRDGVLNANTHYPHTLEDLLINDLFIWQFIDEIFNNNQDNVSKYYSLLQPIVVTNQSGVGKGYYTEEQCLEFETHLLSKISNRIFTNKVIFYHCWSDDEDDWYRKPNPGMLLQACNNHKLIPGFMIGDRDSDVAAGNAANCISSYLYKYEGNSEKDIVHDILKRLYSWAN